MLSSVATMWIFAAPLPQRQVRTFLEHCSQALMLQHIIDSKHGISCIQHGSTVGLAIPSRSIIFEMIEY